MYSNVEWTATVMETLHLHPGLTSCYPNKFYSAKTADAFNQASFTLLLTATYGFPGIRLESLLVVDVMMMMCRLKWQNYEVGGWEITVGDGSI